MEGAGSELVLALDLDATSPAQPATKEPIAATTTARVRLEARPRNVDTPATRYTRIEQLGEHLPLKNPIRTLPKHR